MQDAGAGAFGLLLEGRAGRMPSAATFRNTKATSRGAGVSKTDPIASEV